MKNLSRLILPLAFAVAFVAPTFTYAACTAYTACTTSTGVPGTCDDIGAGNCIPTISAQGGTGAGGINLNVITPYKTGILALINTVFVPVLFAVAFLTFLWGVYKYFILGASEEKSREEGRSFVLWGIVGFVVILSVWGLVAIVGNTFGLSPGGSAPSYPKL